MKVTRKAENIRIPKSETIKMLLDITTLDFYCRYIISKNMNIKASSLKLVKSLFNRIDPTSYGNDMDRINRIEFIKRGLEARTVKKLTDRDMIIQYINGGPLDKPLLDISGYQEISDEELAFINEQSKELAKSYFVDDKFDEIFSLSNDLRNANYTRRSEVVGKIQVLSSELNSEFKRMDSSIARSSDISSLDPEIWEPYLDDLYARETSPTRLLKTGMVGMNMMLDGGFQGSRVYMIFGTAAAGKSMTLLDFALQIKKYNKKYITHDPTKKPCIVFITMENSTDENNSRIFSMISGGMRINEVSREESEEIYRRGGYRVTEDDPIDIIMVYKPNLSVDTDFLYTVLDDMNEMGKEPICIIQDHIKRIRAVNRNSELRLELGEIVNEFKAFANETGLPVITVSHLNREASKTISENKNKKDMTRILGVHNVSESNLMIDNCDMGIIINRETDSNGQDYMAFSQIKTRTKSTLEFFYQPFTQECSIKLVEDVDVLKPAYRLTLRDDEGGMRLGSSKRNDYSSAVKSINREEDDDLFGQEVMGSAISGSVDEILLPHNQNQNMFNMVGHPSEPIFAMPQTPIIEVPIQMQSESIIYEPQLSEWEQELIARKYNSDAKPAVYFLDDKGMIINDGIEDLN